jgi:hypothetical protein
MSHFQYDVVRKKFMSEVRIKITEGVPHSYISRVQRDGIALLKTAVNMMYVDILVLDLDFA